jgi:UDP-N-acetylmuramoylalanine--D-glutamate ligase
MNDLRDKSVLVLGLGETGLSLARYLKEQGAKLRIADSRDAPPNLVKLQKELPKADVRCGVFRGELLDGIDLVAISPGVPMTEPLVQKALSLRIPVVGDIELFARALPQQDKPRIIAITGANGKTTVTSMVGAMCRAAGLDTEVAGNISPAVLDVLRQRKGKQPQVWVLELSSFQLETTYSLSADAATVLNISEDHLDRYEDMAAYIAAKARIFRNDGTGGTQVLNRDDAESVKMALKERSMVSFGLNMPPTGLDWGVERDGADTWLVQGTQRVLNADELQVSGSHNVANALAALALCRSLGIPFAPLTKALREFRGLPHRVEKVAEFNGVTWYDDSKGTNVGATCAALSGLGRPAVVILGGDGKGQDFFPLKAAVAQHARAVVLIGRDAPLIEQAIASCGRPVFLASDMDEAVRIASTNAQSGDAVLMSPACASFDMYRSYLHRAEVFIAAVRRTEAECSAPH